MLHLQVKALTWKPSKCHKPVGYTVGGTVHIVINNQKLVFTTSDPRDARSTNTVPILQNGSGAISMSNGDDPEAVIFVLKLHDFRHDFRKDVVLICSVTVVVVITKRMNHLQLNRLMYQIINKKPPHVRFMLISWFNKNP